MYKSIVVGIDGSELSSKALRHALVLAREMGATLTAVTATEPAVLITPGSEFMGAMDSTSWIADLEEIQAKAAQETLDAGRMVAEADGVMLETVHVSSSIAADAIVDTAKERGADLIVMGSHGRRGLGRLLLGSQAAEVLARSTTPVLVVK
ncbi:Nucleotide-binding universal stress protein, UspA family [Devosia sp. YR412]|uniref:universal stress protein n=1 Tax=Devosia sp. YR412 TaxID=1881030 RepID=UPI0008C5B406|nr:universal stress protein [Devosia sp. YR412]SEP76046.1 Nucleotide-binding universal stress protein, UspA family [Devosia sp. YR412]